MEELLKLLAVQSHTGHTEEMYNYLVAYVREKGWDPYVDDEWNLYVIKGKAETYPCVVAHTDTVHHRIAGGIRPIVIDGKITGINPLTMRQTGIGGDDKCGIWAALHCLEVLPACKAVFFVDEECGCKGSDKCDMAFFKDCRFVLMADRRGNDDFVTNITGELSSDEFQTAALAIAGRFGYSKSFGAFTDVMKLRDKKIGISVANMSAGYHEPHSDHEYIVVSELETVALMMETICKEMTEVFPYTYSYTPPARQVYTPMAATGGVGPGWYGRETEVAESEHRTFWGKPEHNHDYSKPLHLMSRKERTRYWRKLGMVRCGYCEALTKITELMQTEPDPVCLDCELHKEKHGVYPISTTSNIWKRLAGLNNSKKKKRRRQYQPSQNPMLSSVMNHNHEQKDQGPTP